MNATIDKAGRIVVPNAIRTAARLEPGTEVSFRLVSGRIEMESVPAMTETEVEDTIAALRNTETDGEAN